MREAEALLANGGVRTLTRLGTRLWSTEVRAFVRPYLKLVAAALTLGTGASLGPEGPSVEVGKATAARLVQLAGVRASALTTDLLVAGAGAGLAAGFGAPMSGVLFAVETMLLSGAGRRRSVGATATLPPPKLDVDLDEDGGLLITTLLVASVTAAMVSQAGLGAEPAFHVRTHSLTGCLVRG